jgi:hypothetical protein
MDRIYQNVRWLRVVSLVTEQSKHSDWSYRTPVPATEISELAFQPAGFPPVAAGQRGAWQGHHASLAGGFQNGLGLVRTCPDGYVFLHITRRFRERLAVASHLHIWTKLLSATPTLAWTQRL